MVSPLYPRKHISRGIQVNRNWTSVKFSDTIARILKINLVILISASSILGQNTGSVAFMPPLSTGNTTGQVATVVVENPTDQAKLLLPATYYVPAHDDYQSYVVRIPTQVIIDAGGSENIPVLGYCVDIHSPAVPATQQMIPLDEWIQVGDAGKPDPSGLDISPSDVIKIPTELIVDRFTTESVEVITSSSAFKKGSDKDGYALELLFPDGSRRFNGSLKRDGNELLAAPLVVAYVEAIESSTAEVQESELFLTPFSSNTAKENQSINQQTIWIAMGLLDGNEYTRDQLATRVFTQFKKNNGMTSEELSNETKDQLEPGIRAFWESFAATGIHANILKFSENVEGSKLESKIGNKINEI
jgi:hypothetical protein